MPTAADLLSARLGNAAAALTVHLDTPIEVPPLHFSPNVIEDNRQRMARGLPPIQRGYWPGDAKIGLGPSGERMATRQALLAKASK